MTTLEDKTKVQTTFLSQNICISAICDLRRRQNRKERCIIISFDDIWHIWQKSSREKIKMFSTVV